MTNPSDTNLADAVSLDSEIDSQKPINLKLRTVIRALLQASISDDNDLRTGSSTSLSKLSQVHPLHVLSEWLVAFKVEKELIPKTASMKRRPSVSNESKKATVSYMVHCLKPIIMHMTSVQSLNGGDVSHRAVLGQILSALVDEMLADKSDKKDLEVIQAILVTLAKLYMDKVMDVLLLHYQPTSQKVHPCVLESFSKLAIHLPFQVAPFAKSIIDISTHLC